MLPLHIGGVRFARSAFDDITGKREAIIGIGLDIAFGKQAPRQALREPVPERLGFATP
jgi:hypothetical protein